MKIEYIKNAFITPLNPNVLLPYALVHPSPCIVLPFGATTVQSGILRQLCGCLTREFPAERPISKKKSG